MNELKLLLHNFQSISDGELVFKTGLNFIIGQSNSGKSATFRALKACLSNPSGSQRFIKRGHNQAEVTLLYNGNEIIWDRTQKESSYIINGEEFVKTGKSDAFKILNDETGFTRDTNDIIMNIEEELQIPFPFGLSNSDLFKLYENVFCVSDSAIILKSAKEHEDGVKSEITSIELELNKNKSKLTALKDFKETTDIDKLKKYKKFVSDKKDRVDFLQDGLDAIKVAEKIYVANIEINEENFDSLIPPYYAALEVKKALTLAKNCHLLSKSFQELNKSFISLDEKYLSLAKLQSFLMKVKELEELFIPEKDFSSRMSSYSSLVELKITFEKLRKLNKIKIEQKEFSDKLIRYKELKKLKEEQNNINNKIKELEQKKEETEGVIKQAQSKLKEFKVCPLCHHELE